jgi:hypothetical protein
LSHRLYIWKPKDAVAIAESQARQSAEATAKHAAELAQMTPGATATKNRLKDLAWSLDIKESSIYSDKKQR